MPWSGRWVQRRGAKYVVVLSRSAYGHASPRPLIAKFDSHASFDHPICADQHALWDRQAERLGRLQVDHELELGRLLERDVTRLRTLEDLVDESRRASGHRGEVALVGDEAAG